MGGCQGWLGWALCGAWLALGAAALVLLLLGSPGGVPLVGPPAAVAGLALAVFLVYQSVGGALVLSYQPRHPIGWLFCGLGLSAAFVAFARAYTSSPLGLSGGALVAWLWKLFTTPTPFLLGVLRPLLFPTGRLPSPRWRPVAALAAGGCALVLVAQALAPGPLRVAPTIDNPFGLAPAGWWRRAAHHGRTCSRARRHLPSRTRIARWHLHPGLAAPAWQRATAK